jgi:hypothetical protein
MAYSTTVTAVTGGTLSAAQWNTGVRDNFGAIWVGTTAGDIDYYTSATGKNRVAIGTAGKSLVSTGSAPSWAKPVGIWDAWGKAERTSTAALTNTSWDDLSSLSITLTTTRTCTIYGLLTGGIGATDAGSSNVAARLMINGTAQTIGTTPTFSDVEFTVPLACAWSLANVTAGSRIVKAQNILNAGGNMYVTGVLLAWAVVE